MEQTSEFFVSTPLAGLYSPVGWVLPCPDGESRSSIAAHYFKQRARRGREG
jgi:hypothetical protein